MDHLVLISTLVDLAAVGLLAWLVQRSGRERETTLGLHRATLESLRADLSQLVLEAERRAQNLEAALSGREQRLRAILDEIARIDPRPTPGENLRARRAPNAEPASADPAEARLLRDLQLRFEAQGD